MTYELREYEYRFPTERECREALASFQETHPGNITYWYYRDGNGYVAKVALDGEEGTGFLAEVEEEERELPPESEWAPYHKTLHAYKMAKMR